MKKALVTGSAGLVGRHFTRHLEAGGWEVMTVDLTDGTDALQAFRWEIERYDLVIHAAYHVGGRAAIDGTNVNLIYNLQLDAAMFDWAVRTRQKRVLYFSSSAAYPVEYQTREWVRQWGKHDARLEEKDVNLDHILQPDAHYGWAKVTGERQAAVARAHGIPVTVVRPFSGYAEDQSLDYPFPSIVHRALEGRYHVWGPRGQVRDWIHVDDVIGACMAIIEDGTEDPVNLCTGRAVTMADLMRMVIAEAHSRHPSDFPHSDDIEILHLEDKPTGVYHRVGDPTLMDRFYSHRVSLETGIRRAVSGALC